MVGTGVYADEDLRNRKCSENMESTTGTVHLWRTSMFHYWLFPKRLSNKIDEKNYDRLDSLAGERTKQGDKRLERMG